MPRSSRKIVVLLFVTALAATAARAQSPTDTLQLLSPVDLFARLWSLLAQPWYKNGCEVDPSGRCVPLSSVPMAGDNGCEVDPNGTAKNGCELDPDGRYRAAAKNGCEVDPDGTTRNGCELDPNGGRRVIAKNGCEFDPSGRCLR